MKKSIWGEGDKITLSTLRKLKPRGVWLDLASGDGRYAPVLLKTVDSLIAADKDKKALRILKARAGKKKPLIKHLDITKKLPFRDSSFDGVFCAGTLHLFTPKILSGIFSQINRTLRPGGMLVFDFAVDIKRQYTKPGAKKEKSLYSYKEARKLILKNLKSYRISISKSRFLDDLSKMPGYSRITKGIFLLIVGKK